MQRGQRSALLPVACKTLRLFQSWEGKQKAAGELTRSSELVLLVSDPFALRLA